MRTTVMAVLAAALLMAPGYVQAASTPAAPSTSTTTTTTTFTLAPADVTKLKTWITDQKTASVAVPAGFTVAVGQTLPMTVMLHPIPASAGVTAVGMNQYAVVGDKILLVNPTDRKIVYVFS